MMVLSALLLVLLSLLAILLLLLAIPLTLTFHIAHHQGVEGWVTLGWMFDRLHLRLPLESGSSPPHKQASPAAHSRSGALALLRQHSFRSRLLRYLRAMWRAVGKQELYLHIRLGLGDPADTGQLWALLAPLSLLLARLEEVTVQIEPEFMETIFELESGGTLRLIPLQLLGLTLALFFSPAFWLGLRQLRRG